MRIELTIKMRLLKKYGSIARIYQWYIRWYTRLWITYNARLIDPFHQIKPFDLDQLKIFEWNQKKKLKSLLKYIIIHYICFIKYNNRIIKEYLDKQNFIFAIIKIVKVFIPSYALYLILIEWKWVKKLLLFIYLLFINKFLTH